MWVALVKCHQIHPNVLVIHGIGMNIATLFTMTMYYRAKITYLRHSKSQTGLENPGLLRAIGARDI